MLPNIENTDALILNFEKNERTKTKTFRISVYEGKVSSTSSTSSILGKLVLGKAILGNATTNNDDTGGALKCCITLAARQMD
jgi:hypothetical protein